MAKSSDAPLCTICDPPRNHWKSEKHKFKASNDLSEESLEIALEKVNALAAERDPRAIVQPTALVLNPDVVNAALARIEEIKTKNRERQKRWRDRQKAKAQ